MRTFAIGGLWLVVASAASAQFPREAPPQALDYWTDVLYPKLFFSPVEGLGVGGYVALVQPSRRSNFDDPPPFRIAFSLDGQLTTAGSRYLEFQARAPGLVRGWRFAATLSARRRARDNYFGVGNETVFDRDNVTDLQPHFYQADRKTLLARTEISRNLGFGFRALVGFHFEQWEISPLEGASVIADDLAGGTDPTIGVPTDDMAFRVGLVFDTRDHETVPTRGVLLEAIYGAADADVLGDVTYTRFTASARGYLTLSPRWHVAARVAGQVMGGAPGLGSLYLVEGFEHAYGAVGGGSSHRAVRDNRFLGPDKLLGNLDLRYTVWGVPTLYRVSLVAFVDAGRVFDADQFTVTADGLRVGGGTGVFVQLGPREVFGLTLGRGPDGFTSEFYTRWAF